MTMEHFTTLNITAKFTHTLALAVALRIATQALTDATGARNDYSQHISAMDTAERALFSEMVADAAIKLAAQS